MRVIIAVAVAACGCGRSSSDGAAAPPAVVAPTPQPREASRDDRVAIDLPGDANGLVWDGNALYLTDSTNAQIERWTDTGGFVPVASCPHDGKLSLGGLVHADDTFITPGFGFGSAGAVYVLGAGSAVRSVPNLDPVRRRIGIARAPDGTLYDTYFTVAGGASKAGIAKLDVAAGETDVVALAGKPVGIIATADTLYVADQDQSAILAFQRDAPGQPNVIAAGLPGTDLLTQLPGGDLVTGGKHGTVSRVHVATGAVATVVSGFAQVRGLAYDPVKHRLFVVEHDTATSRQHLYVVPYDAAGG